MLNVFLVDDDRHVLQAMTELLEALPDVHVVGHAQDEGLAVDWLIAHRAGWDLAIVDLALGSGNGL